MEEQVRHILFIITGDGCQNVGFILEVFIIRENFVTEKNNPHFYRNSLKHHAGLLS